MNISWLYVLYSISDTPTFLDLYFLLSDMLSNPSRVKHMMQGSDEIIRKTGEAMAELEPTAFTAVMNRISNFVMPAHSYTSRTFCARKSTVDLLSLTEQGKVTAFRIPRNELPDDFRKLLTATIILNVFYAVERRKKLGEGKSNNPIHLVIDEFQNVADLATIDTILSEARKYGLFLITANQHLTQIPENLLKSMEGNSNLIISFRVGPDDAHEIARGMGNLKLESLLATLPNYTAIVKRMDKVFYFKAPKAKESAIAIDRVKEATEQIALQEDRRPIYITKEEGLPMIPAQWAILAYIFTHNSRQMTYSMLKNEMFKKYSWDESVTLSAINYLLDMGYLRAQRDNEVSYTITENAVARFFEATEKVATQRAGGALHNEIVRKLVRQFWEAGYYAIVDTGDERESKPDILVFHPEEITSSFRELTKTIRSPQDWAVPVAYEVETMSNSAEQMKRNLEKNGEKGYQVVFVVPDAESETKLREMLGEGEYLVAIVT